MSLKQILNRKKYVKSAITKLSEKISDTEIDLNEIELYTEKLSNLKTELNEIFNEILTDCKDEEVDKFIEERIGIENNIDDLCLKIGRQRRKPNTLKPEVNSLESIKLPKLNLPSFSGNIQDWLSFKDLFRASVHNNANLSDAQKLQYLKSSLKADAARIVQSIAISDGNYETAWALLEERFSNNREQVFAHIKKLMSIPNLQNESPSAILNLVDTANECIRSLEILDQKIENFSETILVYILLQKLDSSTKLWWERQITNDELPKLKCLTDFLKNHARTLQASKPTFTKASNPIGKRNYNQTYNQKLTLISSTSNLKCIMCENNHSLYKCPKFLTLSVQDRIDFVKKHKLCYNCLSNAHGVRACKSKYNCLKCKKRHSALLHFREEFINKTATPSVEDEFQSLNQIAFPPAHSLNADAKPFEVNFSSFAGETKKGGMHHYKSVLLSTAVIYIKDVYGNFQPTRALLDVGSMSCFMTTNCGNRLGIKREKTNITVSCLNGAKMIVKSRLKTTISNKRDFVRELEFLVVPKITDVVPGIYFDVPCKQFTDKFQLADPNFNKPAAIDVLLGAECFYELLKTGQVRVPNSNLILQNSVFGYIVSGSIGNNKEGTVHCGVICDANDLNTELKRFWEIEEIRDSEPTKNEEEIICEEHFLKTHTRTESGRYTVQMPLKKDPDCLGESKQAAERRLDSLWKRLIREPEFLSLYQDFMKEYEHMGHMEEIKESQSPDRVYYLPHHGVYRPNKSTTKLRVVFDASALTSNGISLNSLQFNGGVIQDDLFAIMLRFRKNRVAFIADICKMYRMILVDPDQRDLLRILWKTGPHEPVKVYRLCTVTYGTTSAPYLATRTLKQLALDEGKEFPLAAAVTQSDFYMDDVLTGAEDIETAEKIQRELIQLLERAGMTLHKWCTNEPELLRSLSKGDEDYPFTFQNETKALGILWKTQGDYFSFKASVAQQSIYTKRDVLSTIAKIFDPLGLIGPIITRAKIFMQRLWLLQIDWDDPLPSQEMEEWQQFLNSLVAINEINVQRHIFLNKTAVVEMHGFADASNRAYAAAIYVKCITETGNISVHLLCSKSRVAPIKPVTIPRLELCAAVLLAQLMRKVNMSLHLELSRICLWSDSTIVLAWIRNMPHQLKTFVANRVSTIQELSETYQWQHVRSEENPADLISRGLDPVKILHNELWWHGPHFLSQMNSFSDLESSPAIEKDDYMRELKKDSEVTLPKTESIKNFSLNLQTEDSFLESIINISNNYIKLKRVVSYIFRFCNNTRRKDKETGPLTVAEMEQAEKFLIKRAQAEAFPKDISALQGGKSVSSNSPLKSLNPFLDDKHILRVGGRLCNSNLSFAQKHPIVLPNKHKLTLIIIGYFHIKNFHVGPQSLLCFVRQAFWPLSGRTLCRKVSHECIVCFKNKPILSEQIMGNLPQERVTPTNPFNHTGVDFCGPFYVKYRNQRRGICNKIYVSIFICLVTRAVHLEIVSDLTSESFIASLKRFFSRRGKSAKLFTDNATNFVGANSEIKKLHSLVQNPDENLAGYLASEGIDWKFLPPRAPNFGGLWEAGVKSFKYHLKREMGSAKFTYEEFVTITTQIEGILNSRPISPLPSDGDELEALTPGHFLIGRPINAIIEPELLDLNDNRLSRWQRTTKVVQCIWKRWKRDYLNNLQQRSKWMFEKDNVKIGNLVLIKEDNLPTCKWLLGRIIELFPGLDNKIRVVKVRTANGILKRAITKICILPLKDN